MLTYLFHRLDAGFDGRPGLLMLDEAWKLLDDPLFAGRIREWLKTLRKRNVSVIFATQSLADIQGSAIAPAIVESCPTRIFLPNAQATEQQIRPIYEGFGLNDRQIAIVSQATPKRDYYLQSQLGNRLFELGLGPIALAFAAASTPADHADIDMILTADDPHLFALRWLQHRGLPWAAELVADDLVRRRALDPQAKEELP
jgi:type IV secretion system protein VirB4